MPLSAREADLLALLLRHARRVVSREQAVAELWQGAATANVVDRYVSNLRRKLGDAAGDRDGSRCRLRARTMSRSRPARSSPRRSRR